MKVNLKEIDGFISRMIDKFHKELELDNLASLATNPRDVIALIEKWYDIKIEVVSDDVGNVDWMLPQKDFELMVLKHF